MRIHNGDNFTLVAVGGLSKSPLYQVSLRIREGSGI